MPTTPRRSHKHMKYKDMSRPSTRLDLVKRPSPLAIRLAVPLVRLAMSSRTTAKSPDMAGPNLLYASQILSYYQPTFMCIRQNSHVRRRHPSIRRPNPPVRSFPALHAGRTTMPSATCRPYGHARCYLPAAHSCPWPYSHAQLCLLAV